MNLSVRSDVNTHHSSGNNDTGGRIGSILEASSGGMSLRNLFASNGREASLRLEDLAGAATLSGGGVGKPKTRDQDSQDAGLAAAMSIARLFVSDPTTTRRRERLAEQPHEGGRDQVHEDDRRGDADANEADDPALDERRLQLVLDKVNAMRAEHDEALRRERLRADDLERENASLRARLRRAAADFDDRRSMAEYAKLIAEQMPNGTGVADSQYVLKLQSQLARALHKMGVLTNQIEMMEAQGEDKVKELQSKLVEQGNESFRAEVEHMNDLLEMEKELEHLKEEHESEASMQLGAIAKMEVELELERSMRCDALSYVKKTKESREERRERRNNKKQRRMSKRDSERSDATAVCTNTSSSERLILDALDSTAPLNGYDERERHEQVLLDSRGELLGFEQTVALEQPLHVELERPLGGGGDSETSSEIEVEGEGGGVQEEPLRDATQAPANVQEGGNEEEDESAESLRLQLNQSLSAMEDLRATVTEQRRTIERLALDHSAPRRM